MRKKLLVLIMSAVMILSLTACSSSSGTTDETTDISSLYGTTFDAEITEVDEDTYDITTTVEIDGTKVEGIIWTYDEDDSDTVLSFSGGEEASIDDLEAGQTISMTVDNDGVVTEIVIQE